MIIWCVLLFISGCIIADTARKYDDKTYYITSITFCDLLKTKSEYNNYESSDARCGHLVGASVCSDVYNQGLICLFIGQNMTIVGQVHVRRHISQSQQF